MADEPDYSELLDKQTQQFVEQTEKWYPPNTAEFSIERQRKIYDAMCREFHHEYPKGVSATDATIPSAEVDIPVRRYSSDQNNAATRIIYFHGGGFVVGGLQSHDSVCAELCARTGCAVTSVDYRLAPEHLHPAAFNDSLAAVLYECKTFEQSAVLCGDSAGGTLAASISHTLRDNPQQDVCIKGQVLIYPLLDSLPSEGNEYTGSTITHANAPMLSTRDVEFYATIRAGRKPVENIVTLLPLKDTRFTGLPNTVVFSAECDPLCDDGQNYYNAITSVGGVAQLFIERGLVHGYIRARHSVDRARESFDRIVLSLVQLTRDEVQVN